MELKSKNTETIIKEKGYIRKFQPKTKIQRYKSKEEIRIGSKKEILRMIKILKLIGDYNA